MDTLILAPPTTTWPRLRASSRGSTAAIARPGGSSSSATTGRRVYTPGTAAPPRRRSTSPATWRSSSIPEGARPFDVRCLTDNVALYTAWANDADRADVFANQLRGLLRPADVLDPDLRPRRQGLLQRPGRPFATPGRSGPRRSPWSGSTAASSPGVDLLDPRPGRIDAADRGIHLVIEHLLMDLVCGRLAEKDRLWLDTSWTNRFSAADAWPSSAAHAATEDRPVSPWAAPLGGRRDADRLHHRDHRRRGGQ